MVLTILKGIYNKDLVFSLLYSMYACIVCCFNCCFYSPPPHFSNAAAAMVVYMQVLHAPYMDYQLVWCITVWCISIAALYTPCLLLEGAAAAM